MLSAAATIAAATVTVILEPIDDGLHYDLS